MKKLIYFLYGVVVVFVVSSCADSKRAKNYNLLIDEASVTFIKDGLEVNQTELNASKLAESHSQNTHLKKYAAATVTDHTAIGDELEKIAIINKIRGGDSLSAGHQTAIANLSNLSGIQFDKAYVDLMIADHETAVKLYSKATDDRIEDIQSFARKTLPVLRMHLDSANAIKAGLK